MSQQPSLAEPEPEHSPVRAMILTHLLWIRLGAFAACTLIFIIFFFMGSQTAISREASIRLLDELRAHIEVVGADAVDDLAEGQIEALELLRVDDDVKLFLVPADSQNLRNAGDGLQVELHKPILDAAKLLQ